MNKNCPLVSVIIPTFNSVHTIETCIKSINQQTYDKLEILIVDNKSSDGTFQKASELNAKVIEFEGKRAAARNFGVKRSSGKYIFHIDSDMELTPTIIEDSIIECEEQNVDAIIVPELSIGEGYWSKCRGLEKKLLLGVEGYESARFMRKEIFENIGGYDTGLEAGEDYDIHHRILDAGYIVSRVESFIKHHEGTLTFSKIISKSKYYGKTVEAYAKKHRSKIKNQLSVPLLYLKKWKILVKNPIFVPGLVIIHFLEFLLMGRQVRFSEK